MYPIKEKCVIHFKLYVDFIGCDYSKGNDHATNDVMTQHWKQMCTPNKQFQVQFGLNEKIGYVSTWIFFPSNDNATIPILNPNYHFNKKS